MKSKGVIALVLILIMLFSATIYLDYDNTPLATLFAPAVPNQIYAPTVPPADEKVVCIVFDDGWKSQLGAIPVLQNYGFNATFAIVTSYSGYPDYMSWADIRSLAADRMDIASHTVTHPDLDTLASADLNSELSQSQQTLRSRGYAANSFVYPYGDAADNRTVRDAVTQYYLVARGTIEGKVNLTSCDRYNLQSYDVYHDVSMADFARFLNDTGGSTVTILYYHKISDDNEDTAIPLATFQAQMQYLKDNGYTTQTLSALFLKNTSP